MEMHLHLPLPTIFSLLSLDDDIPKKKSFHFLRSDSKTSWALVSVSSFLEAASCFR